MHLAPLIQDLALILAVASLVAVIFQRIRQPVVLGYIVAGMIVGPALLPAFFGIQLVSDIPSIRTWADLGIIFLMFTLGLEFSFRKLSRVGISAGLTAVFETGCMMFVGFGVGRLLHWSVNDSLFLGAMLAISSTMIILKALDEMRLKTRRFAEVILAVLVVEDMIAILALVVLSTLAGSHSISGIGLLMAIGQLILVVGTWFLAGYFIIPRFVHFVGRSGNNEVLTLAALGLCLCLVVFASYFHYSLALGAFIMGSILAESTESSRIIERMEPIRDVFSAIFFVSVGMLIDPRSVILHWHSILLIVAVLITGKILFVTLGALITGQTLRTAVQVGFGLGQIGEFSFIIAGLGYSLHATSSELYPIAVAVSLITAFTTPYLIRVSHTFAVSFEKRLPLRVREVLTRYASWTQERRADRARRIEFYRLLFRWCLNALLVTVIFILAGELLLPRLRALGWKAVEYMTVTWAIALLLSAPFVWGMLSTFKGYQIGSRSDPRFQPAPRGGTLLLTRFFTIIWIGILSLKFFPALYAIALTALLEISLFTLFYRQLDASYRWFEKQFLSTFTPAPKSRGVSDMLRDLAPWDAHLVRLKVHPNADIVGKTLANSQLRGIHGVSVVAIQRGLRTLVTPRPEQQIFPKDELLVLGTDEQIDSLRPVIERPPGLQERFSSQLAVERYQLRNIFISEKSPLASQSIRQASLREKFGVMAVGIERDQRRIINPDSGFILRMGDILWVVGEKEQLDRLFQQFEPEVDPKAELVST